MLFPTIEFAIFFFIVFFVSWQLVDGSVFRKLFLVAASYFFYGYWDWRFTFLLFGCSLFNFAFGLAIDRAEGKGFKKFLVAVCCTFNLAILGFFKYFGFFITSAQNLLLSFGVRIDPVLLNIVLPVGISFFTFQAMSYVIDVYRGRMPASRTLLDVLLYISFFPQLVAGPIVRAIDFIPQIQRPRTPPLIDSGRPFILIAAGLFKKIVIAQYLSTLFVDRVFANPKAFSPIELLLGTYGYAVQIYCDFSAYSDIAIGIAALLGFTFIDNFNLPYRAVGIRDFWRRWHISLSTWLRDYLYVPLGGSKKGETRTCINLIITMVLGGLWHGAAWKFVVWGLIHGAGQAIERFVFRIDPDKKRNFFIQALMVFVTFHFVCFTWIFFRAESLAIAFEYLCSFGNFSTASTIITPFIAILIGFGLATQFIPNNLRMRARWLASIVPVPLKGLILGGLLVVIGAFSSDGVAPFIYFQF